MKIHAELSLAAWSKTESITCKTTASTYWLLAEKLILWMTLLVMCLSHLSLCSLDHLNPAVLHHELEPQPYPEGPAK